MRRREVIKRLEKAAREAGVSFEITELTNHTGITVGGKRSTLARHTEVDEVTARKFFKQFSEVLGEGWWR